MKARSRRISGALVLVMLLALLGALQSQASAATVGDVIGRSMGQPTLIHYAGGANHGGTQPNQVLPDGSQFQFVPYSADPLDMTASAEEGAENLLAEMQPDENGVCHGGGTSLGSVAAYKAAQDSDPTICPRVNLQLQGSPNGPGSLAEVLPDNPLIDFNPIGLPDNVTATVVNMRNDGYASCLNQLSSMIECPAGMLVGHYCAVKDLIPGQCYSDFNGEWTEYTVDNVHYKVAETRNPVGVLFEAGVRQFDPNFRVLPELEQGFETVFPQGTPGVESDLPTPRDILQPDLSLEAIPAPLEIADVPEELPVLNDVQPQIDEPLQTWADEVVADVTETWTQQAPETYAPDTSYDTPDMSYDEVSAPAVPVNDFAATATTMVNDVVNSGAVPANLGAQLQGGINNLTSMFGGV